MSILLAFHRAPPRMDSTLFKCDGLSAAKDLERPVTRFSSCQACIISPSLVSHLSIGLVRPVEYTLSEYTKKPCPVWDGPTIDRGVKFQDV